MSFGITSINPSGVVLGTIFDTLNVFFLANIAGSVITGHEQFTSTGTWEALLLPGSNEVVDFKIILDTHVDPTGDIHVVSSFVVPEPSTWVVLATAGLIVPAYTLRRRRRQA
jgi:hypothetical protein